MTRCPGPHYTDGDTINDEDDQIDLHYAQTFNEDATQVLVSRVGSEVWCRWFTWPDLEYVSDYPPAELFGQLPPTGGMTHCFDTQGNWYGVGPTFSGGSVEFSKRDGTTGEVTQLFVDGDNGNTAEYACVYNPDDGFIYALRRAITTQWTAMYRIDPLAGGRTFVVLSTWFIRNQFIRAADGSMWGLTALPDAGFQLRRALPNGSMTQTPFAFLDPLIMGPIPTPDNTLLLTTSASGEPGSADVWEVDCSTMLTEQVECEYASSTINSQETAHAYAWDGSVAFWRGETNPLAELNTRLWLVLPGVFRIPNLRQRQRDDISRGFGIVRNQPTSRQGSIRAGTRNTYI